VRPFLEALQEDRPGDALEALNDALDRGTDLRVYLADTLTYLRALMLLRYGAVTPLRAELPDDELAWLEEAATAWEAGRLRQLVGGFGEALAKLRDPAQLLVQVELVVLGGVPTPEAADRPAGPRREPAERPASAFTPARAVRPAAPAARSNPSLSTSSTPTSATSEASLGAASLAAPAPAPAPPALAPPTARSGAAPEPPLYDDEPWPEPLDPRDFAEAFDEPPRQAPRPAASIPPAAPVSSAASAAPAVPAAPAVQEAPAAPSGPPVPVAATGGEPSRSKWEGMGVGGGTVRAHWETDEDDSKEAVRVVVEAPPPPPPVRRSTNGHAPAAGASAPASGPSAPPEESDGPVIDLEDMRRRWPSIRDEVWSNPIERANFSSCELVGVEGSRLVIQMSAGNLRLLKDEKKRAIRGDLIRILGKGTDVRFIDDKTPYVPPASAAGAASTATSAAPAAPPLPTADPVIQAGLRLFGGPLERLPDET
jgi:DNA polymerase III gamma/tau subunit